MSGRLPPGQRAFPHPPLRFGLEVFLRQSVTVPSDFRLVIDGAVERPVVLTLDELFGTDRVERKADLHCVTTWTATDLLWSGRSLREIWHDTIVPRVRPNPGVAYLLAAALDGYETAVPLEEALGADVLLVDRLNDAALTVNHGAPLRLVVPQLYGYKSVKHLCRLSLCVEPPALKVSRFLVHPRGRVDLEERSGVGLQRFWRILYRMLRPGFLRQARRYQR